MLLMTIQARCRGRGVIDGVAHAQNVCRIFPKQDLAHQRSVATTSSHGEASSTLRSPRRDRLLQCKASFLTGETSAHEIPLVPSAIEQEQSEEACSGEWSYWPEMVLPRPYRTVAEMVETKLRSDAALAWGNKSAPITHSQRG